MNSEHDLARRTMLGQPFVVENRAGASGTIGADSVAKSAPDGYTILVHSASHVSNAHLYRKLPYDTLRDLTGLTPLAVTSEVRLKQFRDVPTLSEAGVSGYELTSWVGCFLPAKTPGTISDKLGAEIKKALENPDVARDLGNQTLDPWFLTSVEFEKRLKADYEKYGRIIGLTGARAE